MNKFNIWRNVVRDFNGSTTPRQADLINKKSGLQTLFSSIDVPFIAFSDFNVL